MANKGIHSEDPSEGCQTCLSGVPAGAFVLACLNKNPVISKLRDLFFFFLNSISIPVGTRLGRPAALSSTQLIM